MAVASMITPPDAHRMELTRRVSSRSGRPDDTRQARWILPLEPGDTWARIRGKRDCNDAFVDRRSGRFLEQRLAGLVSHHAGQQAGTPTPRLEARILEWTVGPQPTDGWIHRSTRTLAEPFGVSRVMVARVAHTGPAATSVRHDPAEFVAFPSGLVVTEPRGGENHMIADDLSTHKTDSVAELLPEYPKVCVHYTPTRSSRLHQAEQWFARIERGVITSGVSTPVTGLKRKLMRHIRRCNEASRVVKRKYFDPSRRIAPSTPAVAVR